MPELRNGPKPSPEAQEARRQARLENYRTTAEAAAKAGDEQGMNAAFHDIYGLIGGQKEIEEWEGAINQIRSGNYDRKRVEGQSHSERGTEDEWNPYKPDDLSKSYGSWIEENNVSFFDYFARRVHETLQDLNSKGELNSAFLSRALIPPKRALIQPLPPDQFLQHTNQVLSDIFARRRGGEQNSLANLFLPGTEPASSASENVALKLYVNPPLASTPEFAKRFYEIITRDQIPIHSAKIHTEGALQDGQGFTAQGHNTLVIYLSNDTGVPQVLKAIAEAEQSSGIPLHSYKPSELSKSPAVLDGKAIVGGPDEPPDAMQRAMYGNAAGRSFDTWTTSVASDALRFFERNKTASYEQIRQVMTEELNRIGKTPEHYLSPGFEK